ncbi:hypothetical protein AVEN_122006-1 [Araneus ventricosus]|uniref:Uncharacterized protein n=1 Tax=Araneus ventricosus TaxID=182803 RepID=A0A4Y2QXN7_ARAVE|nr:hypothetical protein AVEN_122006-1 [Araneus ventricosus]
MRSDVVVQQQDSFREQSGRLLRNALYIIQPVQRGTIIGSIHGRSTTVKKVMATQCKSLRFCISDSRSDAVYVVLVNIVNNDRVAQPVECLGPYILLVRPP